MNEGYMLCPACGHEMFVHETEEETEEYRIVTCGTHCRLRINKT